MKQVTARKKDGLTARLVDTVLAVHCVVFLTLYATDAVLALKWGVMRQPVELYVAMAIPIILRVHWPDYRLHGCKHTLALLRDHRQVLLPFLGLIAVGVLTSLQESANMKYGGGKAMYIMAYRFVEFCGALSAGIFLLRIGWRRVVILMLMVLVGSVLYDTVYPGTYSSVVSRAGGFLENPNLASIGLVMMLAFAVRYDRIYLMDLVLILVGFTAVFATLSRGGQVQFALFLLNYLYFTGRGRRLQQLAQLPIVLVGTVLVGGFVITFLLGSSEMFSAENAQRRVATLSMDNSAVYESDDARLNLIPQYMMLIDQKMLFGYGAGFSRSLPYGPHNTYLDFWVNNGLLGLLLYVWLLLAMLALTWARRFWPGFVFLQVALLAGMFTHEVIHMGVFLILAGLAMSISWGLDPSRAARRRALMTAAAPATKGHPAIAT